MNKKTTGIVAAMLALLLGLASCVHSVFHKDSTSDCLHVVTTTTMITDLANVIGKEHVSVHGLMGPGIDPHLFLASAGDAATLQQADVVVYNGLHLEGKMGEILEKLDEQGTFVLCIGEGIHSSLLLPSNDNPAIYDPHIWFDVTLWKLAAQIVAEGFAAADPENAASYMANLAQYQEELDKLDAYVHNKVSKVPDGQRILITSHDAFRYFGKAYGFEVRGLQGISTDEETGTADVSLLADFIVKRGVQAVFAESSTPFRTMEALQAAVKAKGFDVTIGRKLYSDSLGDADAQADSYILAIKANVDTIVEALQ